MEIISTWNKSITVVIEFLFRNFHMVSKQRFGDRKGKSIMGQEHDVEASTPGDEWRFSEECTRDKNYDYSMFTSRLEEEVDCIASYTSLGVWYIDSGASWHMTRIREFFFSSSQGAQKNWCKDSER